MIHQLHCPYFAYCSAFKCVLGGKRAVSAPSIDNKYQDEIELLYSLIAR